MHRIFAGGKMDVLKRTSKYEIRYDRKHNRCYVYCFKTKKLREVRNRLFNDITGANMVKLVVATFLGLG